MTGARQASGRDDASAVRVAAARLVCAVLHQGASLSDHLGQAAARLPVRDRSLFQELVYGTLRWQLRLEALAGLLVRKPLKARDRDVHCLLLIGLYQLLYLRLPDYAAISSTVQGARALAKPWAVGLLNGALRNAQRQGEQLARQVDAEPGNRYAHPRWLLEALQRDWPQDWQRIADANNARAPMTLRVNLVRSDRESYLRRLHEAGIGAEPAPHAPAGITLESPVDVERLPGFGDGDVSVQDVAAQLTAEVLQVPERARLLDACAAPGGKTALFLERCPGAAVTAIDADPQRLQKVHETLTRLGLQADVRVGDAGDPNQWTGADRFDRILLDAPCSATGVIRRHPDIKALRRASDIERLALQQAALLDGVWPLLEPGGILLYSTCSVLARENVEQVTAFLARHADATELPIQAAWGRPQTHGRQILPGDDNMDGFYFALLGKRADVGH